MTEEVKSFVAVDAKAMHTTLTALFGPAHHIRELQACASLPDSPLALLLDQFNAQCGDAEALELQAKLLTFYQTDSIYGLIKQMSDDITMLQGRLSELRPAEPTYRAPREG